MRLAQLRGKDGHRHVACVSEDGNTLRVLAGFDTVFELAQASMRRDRRLADLVRDCALASQEDYDAVEREGRLGTPIDHPDPAHLLVSGTGITHLGSAAARDAMHHAHAPGAPPATLSDSMKMFRLGLEHGKPGPGETGVQPEWFYKGDGTCIVPPGAPLTIPAFGLYGGEEAEIAGVYIVDDAGRPRRIGYVIGNEFSDHLVEEQNYLYGAHSKLRECSIGPELLLGDLPASVRGISRVIREGAVRWQAEFLSGEDHMSHSLANLEHHHFKYPMFRQPGFVHCHFFGAAVLSFAEGVRSLPGDVFELDVPAFGRPLRNALRRGTAEAFSVAAL